jgi:2-desacetyl-2-hydroxyethyl bacteriochlorophyllide A dehydrogenase
MKAALFEKPHALSVVDRPLRALTSDEILVRVDACGVCGTDVHIVEGNSRSTPPVVLGHEYAGVVADPGMHGTVFSPGERVAIDPNISCGTCFYCRRGLVHLCENLSALGVDFDGGMAEYCIVPVRQAYTLPNDLPAEVCAFIEPISCAVHGIDRARVRLGDSVTILGGGTIGLVMAQLAKGAGAARVIVVEPMEHKRDIARRIGVDVVLDPRAVDTKSAVMDLTDVGADVVIECAGKTSTVALALECVRRGGVVEFFGVCPIGATIDLEPNRVYGKELTIIGSYVNPLTFARAIALLKAGRVRVHEFRIDHFPLDGVHEALEFQRKGKTMKSIIEPHR